MNMVSLKSLVDRLSTGKPVLVKLSTRKLPSVKNDNGYLCSNPFEITYDQVMITQLRLHTPGAYYATVIPRCMEDMRARTLWFRGEFQVEVQPDEEVVKMAQEQSEYIFKNLNTSTLAHSFTVGSDPEIFVELNGELLPAFEFLGSKENPTKMPGGPNSGVEFAMFERSGGCNGYWDGYQAEFTTVPGTCMEFHTDSIASGLRGVIDAARAKYPGAKLSARNVWDIPFERLMNDDEQFVAFGCMPSKNAYGLKANMPPATVSDCCMINQPLKALGSA